jgi:hypothetical protein
MFAVTVAAAVTLVITIPIAIAEETAEAVRVQADIAGSCYSADVGFGSFWMASGPTLDRVDLNDNSIRHVPVRGLQSWHSSTVVGEEAVWLLDDLTTMYKINPQKEQVVKEVPIEQERLFTSLGVGEGAAWVIPGGQKLTRYSATSVAEEATIPSHPVARVSLSPLAPSGSRELETTNCTELILLSIRSLRLLNSERDRQPSRQERDQSGPIMKAMALFSESMGRAGSSSPLLRPTLLESPL